MKLWVVLERYEEKKRDAKGNEVASGAVRVRRIYHSEEVAKSFVEGNPNFLILSGELVS